MSSNSPAAPGGARGARNLPLVPPSPSTNNAPASNPVIPLDRIDAPTQRFYAFAVYAALSSWKIYNWLQVVEDEADSFWLFLKWIAVDFVFLFGLPELRIPWLELSQPVVAITFFLHAIMDWTLMFNLGVPWQGILIGFLKFFYDRELAISEHNVKVSNILHNHSLIMGRQIINILPDGTAVLNPDGTPFCLGGEQKTVQLPIYFNSTVPVQVEIVRKDLDTNEEEVLKLSRAQIRDIERQAKRQGNSEEPSVARIEFAVKKPGAYRLGTVLDEYKLEVQRMTPYSFVVPCPRAYVPPPSPVRCLGDLSDMSWQVDGTPPLKISYRRSINGKDVSLHFQSLQPDGFSSPLISQSGLDVVGYGDVSWARSQRVVVPLNESMTTAGTWQYAVDEVVDGFGTTVKYSLQEDDMETKPTTKQLVQDFYVEERPKVRLEGCDTRMPLKVARGSEKELPVSFHVSGRTPDDTSHSLTWQFSPIDTLTESGDHGDASSIETFEAKNARDRPKISIPGLYTLTSVTSGSCEGEIQEPSSCLLLNPLEPEVRLRSEAIPDLCAGNSIGLRVDLDLIGTPPFVVRYSVDSNGQVRQEKVTVPGMRSQLELIPFLAGQHKYKFLSISDAVYEAKELSGSEYELEQNVKPAAHAMLLGAPEKRTACLEEDVGVELGLQGEPPFTLEWELVHEGKGRILHRKESGLHLALHSIRTGPLSRGGEYTLSLTKIQDARGCPSALQLEQKITVRRQRPRAGFGLIEGKRKTTVVETAKVDIPLRLTGEAPWKVSYKNDQGDSKTLTAKLDHENDKLRVQDRGTYEIVDVRDEQCVGTVDPAASRFEIAWVPRPELSLVTTESISTEGDKYVKRDVCQGDTDGLEIALQGTPPFTVEYSVQNKPDQGANTLSRKTIDTMGSKAAISMDTSKAGLYTYNFSSLGDQLYDSGQQLGPLVLEQKVNARPVATFGKPGQTFKYCKSDSEGGEAIPVTLSGVGPFALEVEIKHHTGSVSEAYRITSIETKSYALRVPTQYLKLGTQQVRIREVQDANGCQSRNSADGPSVQIHLFEAPSIFPLETRGDYCVGERLSYTLSGTPPFEVHYTFEGTKRKAKSATTNFRRVAEQAGEFRIEGVSDRASECRAAVDLVKHIHPMPAVQISKGKSVQVDIHEGSEVDILFEFWGTPPFEFTYTRSTNARKGQRTRVLDTRHDVSHEHTKIVRASQEGTYQVVAIKDRYCAFSTQQMENVKSTEQKRLQ